MIFKENFESGTTNGKPRMNANGHEWGGFDVSVSTQCGWLTDRIASLGAPNEGPIQGTIRSAEHNNVATVRPGCGR